MSAAPPQVRSRAAARPAGRWSALGLLPVAMALLLLLGAAALLVGPAPIPPGTVLRVLLAKLTPLDLAPAAGAAEPIIWQIRMPRVLLAGMAGAALALAGNSYQGVFRNPLADPYVIGVAAGAGLGATMVLVSPLSGSWHGLSLVTPAAFAGALAAVALAVAVARGAGAGTGAGLVLAGVAIAALANAATSFLFIFYDARIASVFAWLMGGFNAASWGKVTVLALYAVPAALVLFACGRLLNVLLLDEEQARQLGVDVERVKLIVLAAASLAAAAAVSVSGLIGFVGLIAPHLTRILVGPDHRRTLPLSMLCGAMLLIGADLVARTALAPAEIPVGVVTAFLGAPFFILLMLRRRGVAR